MLDLGQGLGESVGASGPKGIGLGLVEKDLTEQFLRFRGFLRDDSVGLCRVQHDSEEKLTSGELLSH